ncbi:MAG TPA: LuxR C-terminal-related transcriptional regulator, partial [Anaerolineales bacterium]|nr:LuxR C-terminal-related transcriptional regulator [Anaerolineales bacterium]
IHTLAAEEEPALEWGKRAIELAEKLGATEIFVHAMTNIGTINIVKDDELGKEQIERALQIARENEMHEHVARCYVNLTSTHIEFRQYSQARQWLEKGLEYATARDLDVYTVYMRGWQARMSFETGHWDGAEEQALESLRLSQGEMVISVPSLIALGHLKVRQGDPSAGEFLDQARALALPTGELQRIGPLVAARAEAAWWQGDRDRVIAEATPGYELALNRNDSWTFGPIAYWMWRAGKVDIPMDRLAPPYTLMIQGDWQAAAQEWERIGCPFERALALAEGDGLAKREALAIFEQLGAGSAAQDLRKKLQAQGVKNIPRETRTLGQDDSNDLTPRQLEVLQLIAEGLSNPAIAEKLTVAVGTVKAHTANIYNKLGVKNRVQALSRAQELHLLER